MKLGLGTVQFGMDYAIGAGEGRPEKNEVAEILDLAFKANVQVLDTASLYGNSESVLGQCMNTDQGFRVVTKTPAFAAAKVGSRHATELRQTFRRSLENLGLSKVHALLAHRADDLLGEGGGYLFDSMCALKDEGLVAKIGASVYTAAQIDGLLDRYEMDCIQVPVSVFDQRLISGGYLKALKAHGVEIHSRSTFLKGLAFQEPERLPDYFDGVKPQLRDFHAMVVAQNITPLTVALSFMLSQNDVDVVLCGVTSKVQLAEILAAADTPCKADMSAFALTDIDILNPGRWPQFKV